VGGSHAPRAASPSPSAPAPARARFELVVTADDGSRTLSLHSGGSFDRASGRVALTVDLSAVEPSIGRVGIVAVDGAVFVECPYLARRLGVATRWISVRGSIDDQVGLPVDPSAAFADSGVIVEREIDGAGLVRAVTMRFDARPEGGSAVVSVRYFDADRPVTIDPPPPEEVTDETGAIDRLLAGETGG